MSIDLLPLHKAEIARAPRVLVADDHEWIRAILVSIVQQTLPEASVIEAVDGAAALAEYQAGGADFLVSNHAMPHLDGPGLIREVRRREPDLPIVMVSVNPMAKEEGLAAGANWFLTKEQIMEHLPRLLLAKLRDWGATTDEQRV